MSAGFVDKLKASLPTVGSDPAPALRTYTDKHGNESTMNTTNIGKRPPAPAPAPDHD